MNVNIEASNFDITVPLGLPLYLHPNGSVTTATDAKIENNSQGPIIVKNVKLTPADNWELASFTDDYKIKKVNSNELGFQIMNENVLVDGSINMQAEDWPFIPGNGNIPLNYDGKVPIRSSDNITIAANLELTFDWYKNEVTVYPDKMYLGKGFTKNIEVLSKPENNTPDTALAVNPLLLTAVQSETSDNDITFSSSDESTATVDQNGNVTGLKQGTAIITAASNGKEDRTIVTVFNVSVSAGEGGVVSLGYDGIENFTFAATANSGYLFINWTDQYGSVVSTNALYTILLVDDISLRANFKKNTYTVTTNNDGNGTTTGGKSYKYGEQATITATPNEHSSFINWTDNTGNIISDQPDYTFTVTDNAVYTAHFITDQYNVTLTSDDGGTVTGSGTYDYGKEVTIKANPKEGYIFKNWSDGNTKAERIITVNNDINLSAVFNKISYNVNLAVNDEEAGTVSGNGSYLYDTLVTIEAIPNQNYHFIKWTDENGNIITEDQEYTFTLKNNITYTAYFEADTGCAVKTFNYQDMNFDLNSDCTAKVSSYDGGSGDYVFIPSTISDSGSTYTVTDIGNRAFYQKFIQYVLIPNTVTRIEYAAFEGNCLESLSIPSSVTYIDAYAFFSNNIEGNINIPSSVIHIGGSAFSANPYLYSVTLLGRTNTDGMYLGKYWIAPNMTLYFG